MIDSKSSKTDQDDSNTSESDENGNEEQQTGDRVDDATEVESLITENNDDNNSSKDLVVVKKEEKVDVKPIVSRKKKLICQLDVMQDTMKGLIKEVIDTKKALDQMPTELEEKRMKMEKHSRKESTECLEMTKNSTCGCSKCFLELTICPPATTSKHISSSILWNQHYVKFWEKQFTILSNKLIHRHYSQH